jgi:PAS domain S-box-containing protein
MLEFLRYDDELLRKVLDLLPLGVWLTDAVGNVVFVNPAALRLWGGEQSLALEQHGEYQGWWADTGARLQTDEWASARALRGETVIGKVIDIACFDGTRKTILNSAVPILDAQGEIRGAIVVNEDVTPQMVAEEAMRESEQRYRQMFEKNRAVKLLVDPVSGAIVQANPAACEFYGYSADELLRMKISDINVMEPEQIAAQMARALDERQTYFTFRHRLATGDIRDVAVYSSPLDLQGRRLLYSIVQDITERRRAEEAELHARRVTELLRAANIGLTASLDLDAVLDTLLDNLAGLVGYDSASIIMLQDDNTMAICAQRGYENWTDPEILRHTVFAPDATPTISRLMQNPTSLLIADTRGYPGWRQTPGSEHIRNWLGVPLLAGGKLIGLCSLDKVTPNSFTLEDVRLVEALAAQAATAIQNAQLYEQVQVGRVQLQSLSRRLVEVQESERRRIARELHDDAGQALTSLMVGLRLLERDADHPEAVLKRVAELRQMADGVLENLHRLAMDLRPASLDHVGLASALQQYVEVFGRQNGLGVQFDALGLEGERLAPEVETNVYRIVQEALTNVVRHAQAKRVSVLLERRGDRLLAIVEDDGVGFDTEEAAARERMGLFGMRERAEMVGGTLALESSPGRGTTIFVEAPYGHSNPDRG